MADASDVLFVCKAATDANFIVLVASSISNLSLQYVSATNQFSIVTASDRFLVSFSSNLVAFSEL